VAIWERASGRLIRVLDAPRGLYADNAGLAFSPDGRRFAFAAGHEARMWDVETGEKVGSWTLPEGFTDTLAFRGPDRLLLLRTETRDGKGFPYRFDPANHPSVRPRAEVLRDLLGKDPAEPIRVIEDFNWEVRRIDAAPDGSRFVIEGVSGPEGKTRTINAYDATGARLWALPSRMPLNRGADFQFDTSGKLLLISMDKGEKADLIDMRSRKILRTLSIYTKCLSTDAESWIVHSFYPDESTSGLSLHDRHHDGRIVQIFTNTRSGYRAKFSPDGKHTAWGNGDGSVTICDWEMIRRRLNDIGLGW
jgi:WD40 repeat protein